MDNIIGKRLDGRYEIIELIGVGGMANVYRAMDLLDERTVAVKILRDEFVTNVDFVRRFKNESKAISLLNHPNIVKVFDVSVTDKVQYIVMEFVDGVTLKEYIEQRKKLSWKETIHFTTQLLEALEHAHEKGIVHRDVKPQNIMLLTDGSIKVMDFGIARFSRSEHRTITDKAIGSVHYISPEQASGDATDNRSDIYSTGIIIYEMLTGVLPFDSDSPVGVAIKQISDIPKPPRELNSEIPEGLEEITLRAMEKEPKNRYQTAQEMLEDIEKFKNDPSILFEYQYMQDNSSTKYIDKVETKDLAKKTAKPQPKKVKIGKFQFNLKTLGILAATFAAGAAIIIFVMFKLSGNPLFSSKKDVDVPNFIGMTKAELEQAVIDNDYKFKFEFIEDYSDKEAGIIYDQTPRAKKVKENQEITIKISLGIEVVEVPNLNNFSRQDAEKALTDLGLNVNIVPVEDKTLPENKVFKTDPVAGQQVNTGTTVVVYIATSQKIQEATVPNVVGQLSREAARDILVNNNLRIGSISMVDSDAPVGSIIDQSPKEGEKVNYYTQVNLTISQGRPAPPVKSIIVTVTFDSDLEAGSAWSSSNGASYVYQPGVAWSFVVDTDHSLDIAINGSSGPYTISINYETGTAAGLHISTPKAPIVSLQPPPAPPASSEEAPSSIEGSEAG